MVYPDRRHTLRHSLQRSQRGPPLVVQHLPLRDLKHRCVPHEPCGAILLSNARARGALCAWPVAHLRGWSTQVFEPDEDDEEMNARYPLARLRAHLQREADRDAEWDARGGAAPSNPPGPHAGGGRAGEGGAMPQSFRGAANPWANMGSFQIPGLGVAGIQVHMSVNGVPVPVSMPGMQMPPQPPGMSHLGVESLWSRVCGPVPFCLPSVHHV